MSASRTLNLNDWRSVGRHLLYPLAGVALVTLFDALASGTTNWRALGIAVGGAVAAAAGRLVRRYLLATETEPPAAPA